MLCNTDLTIKFIFSLLDNIFLGFTMKKVLFHFVIII